MSRPAVLAIAVLASATAAAAIEPGEWESRTQFTDIQLPGDTPPEVSEMLRTQMMQNVQTATSCVTQDDIDNAPERMFDQTEGQCEYSRFQMDGGVLDAQAQCASPDGTVNMTMSGTYTDTTYSLVMDVQMDSPMGAMQMTADVNGNRIGNCG